MNKIYLLFIHLLFTIWLLKIDMKTVYTFQSLNLLNIKLLNFKRLCQNSN